MRPPLPATHPSPGPGSPLFWGAQAVFWLILQASLLLPLYGIVWTSGIPVHGLAARVGLGALAGLGVSSAMAVVYARLPVRFTQGSAAVATVLVTSLLGAVVWCGAQLQIIDFSAASRFLRPEILASTFVQPIIQLTRCFLALGLWSAIFFVLLLSHRVHVASVEALASAQVANQAQLQLLRAQLEPHFLFNSLNSVIALVESDPPRAKDMVRSLSALLREALSDSGDLGSTVGDELDFVRNYLSCERVRYEDRLRVSIAVPESLRSQPLPRMTLQPLVENAIKHGLRGQAPLCLRIEGSHARGRVELTVANSRVASTTTPAPAGTGTGLSNVRSRMQMMFPDSGEVSLHLEEQWSRATICFEPSNAVGVRP